MKPIKFNSLRRALSVLMTGLVLGGMFAATASAVGIYSLKYNYPTNTTAPYNAGGGVPSQTTLQYFNGTNIIYGTLVIGVVTNNGVTYTNPIIYGSYKSVVTTNLGVVSTNIVITATNVVFGNNNITGTNTYGPNSTTFYWYGPMGWSSILASTDLINWTPFSSVMQSDYGWSVTEAAPTNQAMYFRLIQTNAYAGSDQCSSCHGTQYLGWKNTPHSYAIKEHVNSDGSLKAGSSLSCIVCHSVGDNQPTGYAYNTNAGSANYTSPLANVGCEACHGPAGWHKNSEHDVIRPVVSVDPSICGSCHQGAVHPTFTEYTNVNATASSNAPAGVTLVNVNHFGGGHNQFNCAWCHNAVNRDLMVQEYYDRQAGNPHPVAFNSASSVPNWTAACVTCHDPHGSNYVAQLRYPTFSTNYYTIPTASDTRSVVVTNFGAKYVTQAFVVTNITATSTNISTNYVSDYVNVVATNSVYVNTVIDSLYNPNIQVCAQCHNGRGARWDGTAYGLITNSVVVPFVTNVVYYTVTTTNGTYSQIFTNVNFVTGITNITTNTYPNITYNRASSTNIVGVTNIMVGVGVYATTNYYVYGGATNPTISSSGFSAPHYAPQYNVLIGQLNDDYQSGAGVTNVCNDPHTLAPNQCADCHVPAKYATGAHSYTTGHSFASDNNGCLASCHSSLTSTQLVAKTANLKTTVTNGITRVVSLLNQWGTNVAVDILRTNYAQLAWEYNSVGSLGTKAGKYQSGPPSAYSSSVGVGYPSGTNDNLQLSTVPQDIWIARFSLYMIWRDQSLGVHNPTYVKSLLADAEARVAGQFTNATYPAYFTGDILSGTNAVAPVTTTFTAPYASGTVSWNFGDSGSGANNTTNTASGSPAAHTFSTNGFYTVTCTVGAKTFTRAKYIAVW